MDYISRISRVNFMADALTVLEPIKRQILITQPVPGTKVLGSLCSCKLVHLQRECYLYCQSRFRLTILVGACAAVISKVATEVTRKCCLRPDSGIPVLSACTAGERRQLLYHRQVCKKTCILAGQVDLVLIVVLCARILQHRNIAADESQLDAQPFRSARKGFINAAPVRNLRITSRQSQRLNLKQIRKACLPGWMG